MARTRRTYTPEFKVEAVKLVTERGYSVAETARSLGLHETLLRSWKQALEAKGDRAFPGQGKLSPFEEEDRRLRAENSGGRRRNSLAARSGREYNPSRSRGVFSCQEETAMSRLRHRAALVALAALLSLSAAHDQPARAPEPAAGAAEVVARLRDGTVVRKALLRDGVVVVTRFGKLTVPAAEIRRIEFALHLPAEAAREVEGLVKQLGSDDYKLREAAGKRLVALGYRAYPALQTAARSPDKEVAARARAAAEQVRREVPAERLSLPEQDVVYTRDCVLAGRIEGEALKARTASLGKLSLRLAELRSLHSAAVDRAEVAVEAAQFGAAAGKWADSGVTVEAGAGLVLAASGRVDLMPAKAGQHVSGPVGYPARGSDAGYQAGTLLGRVGEEGEVFAVGQRYEGRSPRAGRLYLRIVPLAGGNGSAGAYQVKVSSGPGLEVEGKGNSPATRQRGADSGGGTYGRHPPCHPGCFPAGTPIRTPGGSQPVERLRAGDLVTTVGPDGATAPGKVVSVFATRNRLVEVRTEAGGLVTTETQPLALAGGGLRAAGELQAGDRVFRWDGHARRAVAVRSVSPTGRQERVFNLILGEPAVFVAGGFLVRSKPPAPAVDPAEP
jgi:transposase-like protein